MAVQTIEVSDKKHFPIELLQLEEQELSQPAEDNIVDYKTVELVAMNRYVAHAHIVPGILLVDFDPDQVRHQFRQSLVVVPLDPDDLYASLRIRELADVGKKVPVLFFQAAKIQVGKDVTEQYQTAERAMLEQIQGVPGPADLRAKVQVGNDDRVEACTLHAPFL